MTHTAETQTDYARAFAGFDPQFRDTLIEEIASAIAQASLLRDVPIMAIRTGETAEALIVCLIATMAMSPTMDTPSELRAFTTKLAKRVHRGVAEARVDPTFAPDFFGVRKEGTA
jgi:hypothetical protein